MMLVFDAMETFRFLDKIHAPDSVGGVKPTYSYGAEFQAVASVTNDTNSIIADQLTEKNNCKIYTSRTIVLDFMDLVVRMSDGQVFRVLSDGKNSKTPEISSLDLRTVRAEMVEPPEFEVM